MQLWLNYSFILNLSHKIIQRLDLMSTASKLTLAGTTLGAIGIVIFVHYAQVAEKDVSPVNVGPGTSAKDKLRPCMLA